MFARAPFTVSPSVLARAYLSRSTALFSSMDPISAYAPRNSSYAAARSDTSASAGSRGIDPANVGERERDEEKNEEEGEREREREDAPRPSGLNVPSPTRGRASESLAPSPPPPPPPPPPRTVVARILISASRLRTVSASRAISARNSSSPAPGRISSASASSPGRRFERSPRDRVVAADSFSFSFAIARRSPRHARRTTSRKIRIAALIFSIDAPRSRSFSESSPSTPPASSPSPPLPPALQYASTSARSRSISLSVRSPLRSFSPRSSRSSSLSSLFSSLSLLMTRFGSSSSFTSSSLATHAMRCAKRHVLIPSRRCSRSGHAVATITVRQFPPRESRSIIVIVESR